MTTHYGNWNVVCSIGQTCVLWLLTWKTSPWKISPQYNLGNSWILKLVHFDICYPFPLRSLTRSFYFMTFVDDFSCKIWVYFVRQKNEAFSKFLWRFNAIEKLNIYSHIMEKICEWSICVFLWWNGDKSTINTIIYSIIKWCHWMNQSNLYWQGEFHDGWINFFESSFDLKLLTLQVTLGIIAF